jgi:hypothetical protein
VDLNHPRQSILDVLWNHWLLIGACRNHHMSGFDGYVFRMHLEVWGARLLPERDDWGAALDGRSDVLGVSFNEAHNLIAWRKAV